MGWDVDFVHTKHSIMPNIHEPSWWDMDSIDYSPRDSSIAYYPVESANDAMEDLEEIVPQADVIIHAMAVADFGFKKDSNIKLKSDDPEALVEYIRSKIVVNPKIISNFRKWNTKKDFFIVSFKFEIDKTKDELCDIALNSLHKNKCNLVVANDKAEMMREKEHIGYIVYPEGYDKRVAGKGNIVKNVYSHVRDHFYNGNCYME
jgi:phosphopantothenate-cysteine ligase